MSSKTKSIDLDAWVQKTQVESQKEFRQAVHVILTAIASEPHLRSEMVIKGGILLAIGFDSELYVVKTFWTSISLI